ncbi:hypothetical protein FEM48_Zijuj02G0156500 [Ziziphus jujuba var. spinosa]|uniref:Xylanase inhibitor C-terminal domain-containing protein n=1 Tax=Ziziphus jujuba var. spinosa TaxID=714518 RepID=A0A978VWJ0_ZIZJJ|nr:hypothetical protein FEM48_Zijuj02G0156500 [Ziziphus jujuba var. spinosa]
MAFTSNDHQLYHTNYERDYTINLSHSHSHSYFHAGCGFDNRDLFEEANNVIGGSLSLSLSSEPKSAILVQLLIIPKGVSRAAYSYGVQTEEPIHSYILVMMQKLKEMVQKAVFTLRQDLLGGFAMDTGCPYSFLVETAYGILKAGKVQYFTLLRYISGSVKGWLSTDSFTISGNSKNNNNNVQNYMSGGYTLQIAGNGSRRVQTAGLFSGIPRYFVKLLALSIEGKLLSIDPAVGGLAIDSGFPYTYLVETAYGTLKSAMVQYFRQRYQRHPLPVPPQGLTLDLCYTKPRGNCSLPSSTYHFDGANLVLNSETVF